MAKETKIEAIDPNFTVGKGGLKIKNNDSSIFEFRRGDGIRVVAINKYPYLEFKVGDKPVHVKITTREQINAVFGQLEHATEFKTESMELMEAFAKEEKDFPVKSLVEAYAAAAESQPDSMNKTLTHTVRAATLTVEDRVKLMYDVQPALTEGVVEVILVDAKKASEDDEDEDEYEEARRKHKGKKESEEDDEDEDEDD